MKTLPARSIGVACAIMAAAAWSSRRSIAGAVRLRVSLCRIVIGRSCSVRLKLDAAVRLAQFYSVFKIIGADQRPYGPVSADQLRQWIADGRADARTLAQAEGGIDWRPLVTFTEFAGLFPAEVPPPPGALPPMTGALAPASSSWTPPAPRPDVPTYLPHAIIVTLCCCPAFGVPALVYAMRARSKLDAGDYVGALEASNKARVWFWIAIGATVILTLIELIFFGRVFSLDGSFWRM
jgi:hypothetical protein